MSHSNKRKKEESPAPSSKRLKKGRSYTQHEKFWASDGNVVLQLDKTRFKVHRSRLTSQSIWFRKLFEHWEKSQASLKNGDDDPAGIFDDEDLADIADVRVDKKDGCYVYNLDTTGVKIIDFEAILTTMDNGIAYYYAPPTFRAVASILRSATIFKFEQLRDFAVRYLNEMYSDLLEDMDKPSTPEHGVHAAEAIILGRNLDMDSILKRAFYELARKSDLGTGEDEEEDEEDLIYRVDNFDLVRLARGQKRLIEAWLHASTFPALECPAEQPCDSSRVRIQQLDIVTQTSLTQTYRCDPIGGIQKLIEVDWYELGYCEECRATRIRLFTEQRENIWEEMGHWFCIDE
ncbi:hypothetical protein Hypma_001978 [Hypsizygus marmoreus]|uniref:BTB domain-containing protein n=1 Tax=Hypsizygus marmoreus TaxID=39966 RepID=A0A369J5M3_HYPMA|nr:hypothetical protein Hypma_001978 [Hypsizygus marmoreus]